MRPRGLKGVAVVALGVVVVLGLVGVCLAAEGHGGGEGKVWDFVARAMNFALLLGLLIFLVRKPIAAGLRGRAEQIRRELEELEARRAEAQRAYEEMARRLKDAEAEQERILAEFRAMGEKEKEKILAEARNMAERIRAQAQWTIEQEVARAKAELRQEVAEMSAAVAEELIKAKITPEDHQRLVDEYLAKVEREVQ